MTAMMIKIPKSHRTHEDEAIRAELEDSLPRTKTLLSRLGSQWPEILEISSITQPRLEANGFTEAIAALVNPKEGR